MTKIRVALIEDHDLTRVGIRTALQQRGEIEFVGEAANGTEGLRLLSDKQPDVAIVDIGLPDMDGIELTRRFKAAQAEAEKADHTKVLVLTLQDDEEAKREQKGLELGDPDSVEHPLQSHPSQPEERHAHDDRQEGVDPQGHRELIGEVGRK